MAKLVPYSEYKEARARAQKLIHDVRRHPSIHKHYKFVLRPIGSQSRRCVIKDNNGKYDLDYQIVITKNSKDGDGDPTAIKKAFLQAFTDCRNNNESVEDSTTVVTVRYSKNQGKFDASKEKFSFDFVIISIDEEKRIRRNGPSLYTWNELPSRNTYIYERYKRLNSVQQRELLENHLIPRIINEKQKDKSLRCPTIDFFYQEVNNYYQRNKLQ
ncbi:MAG: hypothetical protein IJT36_09265 [Alphaproteobacteria bacterium]|nr:hypothetical protein [Clostridia bacterium]MBQ7674674.1 hypothetical protein [Alphaproteobacteria bacterium]